MMFNLPTRIWRR